MSENEHLTEDEPVHEPVDVREACVQTLAMNRHDDGYTMPAPHLYPHQWLWDSCFIAIGLRHYDQKRAKKELTTLLRGQWSNGMIPNIIFNDGRQYHRDREIWQSWINPFAPDKVATSGITQPPMLAEAIVRVGETMQVDDRRAFYKKLLPALINYHSWLYTERDPHREGLTLQIHPYEVGLDNTPPWTNQLREHHRPWWLFIVETLRMERAINWIRRDTRHVPPAQRMNNTDALLLWDVMRRLRRKAYDIDRILHRSLFITEDLTFNCIFIRANFHLRAIASEVRFPLPKDLLVKMKRSEEALEELWSTNDQQYFSRDFITHKLLNEPTIAGFMPLYAGTISKERAGQLVEQLKNHKSFWLHHPVPSVPLMSPHFNPQRYWQGPTWINTNWLIIDGLKRYGFVELAEDLRQKTISMVETAGPYEYFSPIDGIGLGSPNFSWTAALTLDLLEN